MRLLIEHFPEVVSNLDSLSGVLGDFLTNLSDFSTEALEVIEESKLLELLLLLHLSQFGEVVEDLT